LINKLNIKSNKKKKTYFYSFKLPITKYRLLIFFSILQSEKYIPSTCKTAFDDIWAYLSILRAITAVCFKKKLEKQ
jgi:hypothetical protein